MLTQKVHEALKYFQSYLPRDAVYVEESDNCKFRFVFAYILFKKFENENALPLVWFHC